jgi:transcriptional regulator with XRE-family HTH domain
MADRPDKKQLGEKIKAARAEKGWKQKHLAAAMQVEPITVSRWERGATTPGLAALRLVAEKTGKPVSYFVGSAETAAPAELAQRVDALEQSLARVEQKLAALLDRLPA